MPAILANSLGDLGPAIAQEVGPYFQLALTATGPPSQDQFVSAQMIDDEAPPERYGGYYAYSHGPSVVGQQHRVRRAGFLGATGTFTTNGLYSVPPAVGTSMSLLGVLPMVAQDGLLGIRECVNRAIRKLWTRVRLPIMSQGPSVTSYDLGARWWMSKKRVVRLLDPEPAAYTGAGYGTGVRAAPSSIRYDVSSSGETWALGLGSGMPAGQQFYLECEAPANSRLYHAADESWTDQASPVSGLFFDGDACLGDWNSVFACSLFEVFRALALQAGGSRKGYWAERLAEQRSVVSTVKLYEIDAEPWTLGEGPTTAPSSATWGDKGWSGLWGA